MNLLDLGKPPLHFTLIDPDKQDEGEAAVIAGGAQDFGSDAIMVGGSTAHGQTVSDTVFRIKRECSLPVILFPSGASGVCTQADYLFFMMLMNSQSPRFLVGEQVKAAPFLRDSGVEPISMGYIVVSTSENPTKVEQVGRVDRILPGEVDKALAYALCAQYFGLSCVYLEAGSGASRPVPYEMIKAVKTQVNLPLIVGGGVRDVSSARGVLEAGADVLVTGTIAEENLGRLSEIVSAVKR
ncbi:MAG: geranylgeranylglyceryl/heptaprenylglyceryl phosphate synthase [Candidatus Altiarchaeales archaeon]|nr:geranylgeranylglyceryl/heptaprenylglyceryl phosphate synthase [Candidatus Altiarchaeales archaeon]